MNPCDNTGSLPGGPATFHEWLCIPSSIGHGNRVAIGAHVAIVVLGRFGGEREFPSCSLGFCSKTQPKASQSEMVLQVHASVWLQVRT